MLTKVSFTLDFLKERFQKKKVFFFFDSITGSGYPLVGLGLPYSVVGVCPVVSDSLQPQRLFCLQKATFWNSFCSSLSPMEAVGKAAFTLNQVGAQGRGQQARSPMQRGGQTTSRAPLHGAPPRAPVNPHLPSALPNTLADFFHPVTTSSITHLSLFLLVKPH